MEKKKVIQALPEIEPEQEIIIKPSKAERKAKYEKKKKAVKESKTEVKPHELKKNDSKIHKQALNGTFNDIDIINDKFTIILNFSDYIEYLRNIHDSDKTETYFEHINDMEKEKEKYMKDYVPIHIPNEELLVSTIVFNLTDLLLSDKKEHNIYANIVINYMSATAIF